LRWQADRFHACVLEVAHDVDTFAYLTDLLRKLAAGWPDRQLDDLLPEAWAAAHAEPTLGN
jgi:hypothetical protein